MRALTNREHLLRSRLIHLPNRIDENPGRIDDRSSPDFKLRPALSIPNHRSSCFAVVLGNSDDFGVVDREAAQIRKGVRQSYGQSRVIKLSIKIENPPFQLVLFDRRQMANGFGLAQRFGGTEGELSGEPIVNSQTDCIKRNFPEAISRNHELERVYEVRGILQHQPSLMQGFPHQGDIALLQVANAAMSQFRRAARGSLCKICLFYKKGSKSARRSLYRGAETCRSAA